MVSFISEAPEHRTAPAILYSGPGLVLDYKRGLQLNPTPQSRSII